jgi:hypothetical protein
MNKREFREVKYLMPFELSEEWDQCQTCSINSISNSLNVVRDATGAAGMARSSFVPGCGVSKM